MKIEQFPNISKENAVRCVNTIVLYLRQFNTDKKNLRALQYEGFARNIEIFIHSQEESKI